MLLFDLKTAVSTWQVVKHIHTRSLFSIRKVSQYLPPLRTYFFFTQPVIKLNNGVEMPAFGFGTWLAEPGVVGESVRLALKCGYKHIDCAAIYENEPEIGNVFGPLFSSGEYNRKDIFITSKAWVSEFKNIEGACKKTLSDLQLEYLDLYLLHLPFETENGVNIGYNAERIQKAWESMEDLVAKGLVKSVGVSNFTILKLEELLKHSPKLVPACNQVEAHPYLPQKRLHAYCKEKGISIMAYTSLGNVNRPSMFKYTCEDPVLLEDPVVKKVAERNNATVAQVLLAWALATGFGVIPKSVREERIKENLDTLKVNLSPEDLQEINGITIRHRYLDQNWALTPGQKVEELWDGEMLE
ncbi:aldo-keto reductase family 1 member B1 isoform X1 [Hydra vulgaris]|uniref:aldo-keto reductase family 1 member B1 isoform X1 n=1 Tax=Hydra vulgaris TaxID=6087 RepID=UPI001F5FD59A|nr:aldo-keto reductase family 1 member B1 isoform X1 [Hydra vulgaris]